MAEWDLISKIGPYLDRHLVFPLLEFLTVKEYYVETDLLRGKLDLLSNTSMVDFAIDVHNSLYPDKEVPATLRDKRAQVKLKEQMPLNKNCDTDQCCGSGSGIRCLFDPWTRIRDPE